MRQLRVAGSDRLGEQLPDAPLSPKAKFRASPGHVTCQPCVVSQGFRLVADRLQFVQVDGPRQGGSGAIEVD
jgi:hypothetical protein